MKVILKQDVNKLGKKEDLVEVNDGYARNYLIPKGLAVEANATNLNIMKSKKKAEKLKKEKELENARQLASRLEGSTVTIKTKAGENGKLFGSITSMDISDSINKAIGVNIDKKKINIPEPIKTLGTSEVEVRLYQGVQAKVLVKVEEL